jgi:hypothetical protein
VAGGSGSGVDAALAFSNGNAQAMASAASVSSARSVDALVIVWGSSVEWTVRTVKEVWGDIVASFPFA